MKKTSDAQLKALKKYNEKSKFISLKYTPNQLESYDKLINHCKNNNLSVQGYIKDLIDKDLNKGN